MGIIILGSYTSLGQTAASEATATTRAAGGEAITSAQVFVYFSIWKIQSDFFSFLYCLVLHNVLKNTQKVSFSTLQQNSDGWRLLLSETISSITSDFSMMKLLQFPISLRKHILQWSIKVSFARSNSKCDIFGLFSNTVIGLLLTFYGLLKTKKESATFVALNWLLEWKLLVLRLELLPLTLRLFMVPNLTWFSRGRRIGSGGRSLAEYED